MAGAFGAKSTVTYAAEQGRVNGSGKELAERLEHGMPGGSGHAQEIHQ